MWRRLTAPILLPLVPLVTACSTVVTVPSPAEFVIAKAPRTVWVTKSDHTVLRLEKPRVIPDTLSGFERGSTSNCRCRAYNRCARARLHRGVRRSSWAGSPLQGLSVSTVPSRARPRAPASRSWA